MERGRGGSLFPQEAKYGMFLCGYTWSCFWAHGLFERFGLGFFFLRLILFVVFHLLIWYLLALGI